VDLSWCPAQGQELARDSIQVFFPSQDHATPVVLKISASRLFAQKKLKLDPLLAPWLTSVYMGACGFSASLKWIFSDSMLSAKPMDSRVAKSVLLRMLSLFYSGQSRVMPVPFKTALAFALDENLEKARSVYEGSQFNGGGGFADLKDPCWVREFPSFDALVSSPSVPALWTQLYLPLVQWSKNEIEVKAFG
jgi:exonuclease V gamma subunit